MKHARWNGDVDWYPFYPTDFRRDTLHLSLAEDGAYRRLIDEYMIMRGPLPDDDVALARLLGVGVEEWLAVATAVRKFFCIAANGRLIHRRCEREIMAQENKMRRFSERGQKAAFAKWSKINGLNATRMLVHATRHNKDTSTESHSATAVQHAPQKESKKVAADEPTALKRPAEMSRAEFEERLAARREADEALAEARRRKLRAGNGAMP